MISSLGRKKGEMFGHSEPEAEGKFGVADVGRAWGKSQSGMVTDFVYGVPLQLGRNNWDHKIPSSYSEHIWGNVFDVRG